MFARKFDEKTDYNIVVELENYLLNKNQERRDKENENRDRNRI